MAWHGMGWHVSYLTQRALRRPCSCAHVRVLTCSHRYKMAARKFLETSFEISNNYTEVRSCTVEDVATVEPHVARAVQDLLYKYATPRWRRTALPHVHTHTQQPVIARSHTRVHVCAHACACVPARARQAVGAKAYDGRAGRMFAYNIAQHECNIVQHGCNRVWRAPRLQVIALEDVAIYGSLCALATFDRAELKSKVPAIPT